MKRDLSLFWRLMIGGSLLFAVINILVGEFRLALSLLGMAYLYWRLGDQEREIESLRREIEMRDFFSRQRSKFNR